MKLTFTNFREYVPTEDCTLFQSLLVDLIDINQRLKENGMSEIFIDFQEYHDEYSPERTDPCPDYYGYYRIYSQIDPYNHIGLEMNIHQLDDSLCLLNNFIEMILKK